MTPLAWVLFGVVLVLGVFRVAQAVVWLWVSPALDEYDRGHK